MVNESPTLKLRTTGPTRDAPQVRSRSWSPTRVALLHVCDSSDSTVLCWESLTQEKHMASLFLMEVATGCAERRPSLQVLHKLCIISSQHVAYKVFKSANVTNIPEQQCPCINYSHITEGTV